MDCEWLVWILEAKNALVGARANEGEQTVEDVFENSAPWFGRRAGLAMGGLGQGLGTLFQPLNRSADILDAGYLKRGVPVELSVLQRSNDPG